MALPQWLAVAFLVIPLLPRPAQAVICKTVDENGVVSYTDTPSNQCVNPVKLRGYSSYPPRQIDSPVNGNGNAPVPESGAVGEFAGYSVLRIVQPSNNATVRSNEGKVPVQISLQPALQAGHSIRLILDGQSAGAPINSTDIVLSGIDRGTHQLAAEVLDENGTSVGSMNAVVFTLQRAVQDADEAPATPGGYEPDYESGGRYVPPSGGIPQSPGSSPDFSPNYDRSYNTDFAPGNNYAPQPGGVPQAPAGSPAYRPNFNR